MISAMLLASLGMISLAVVGCLYRLLAGPSMADRMIALDAIGIHLLAMVAVICMMQQTGVYIDIILLIGILTFIGTTAFAKYIERGVVIERGDGEDDR
ncbi:MULTISPECIES: Na(+)/H(+) antiporter subunit F1 [unclassified Paenibacillus]|uniref:Na(+)/H(+) antiporter subunit F1 n=1 Tax=unclassified Paenibacillus TaxID=185978 RepID=UPI001C0FF311|nr:MULTISPECIES: Na(+)/H(+) antiporter subunit F1 [unclassified Paenibacillus]MBU5442736.1 Na(+)/H(+) antiporter subunit F1 [Paenibacillus sp. MSJ-34]CAH0120946.1 Na(+)/H(+) antiporter subunit F [Paenibacillus sp. CECT 9249]